MGPLFHSFNRGPLTTLGSDPPGRSCRPRSIRDPGIVFPDLVVWAIMYNLYVQYYAVVSALSAPKGDNRTCDDN